MQSGRSEAAGARLGEAAAAAQAKAVFLLALRARGIQDLEVLRALETIPREIFVPHRYVDLARRDLALPLRCGQTLPEPWLAARMIEVLAPASQHRVLEIGTGSGYATALLARIAREVLSIERFQSLAIEAGARLERLEVRNAGVVWGDGLAMLPQIGLFDRVIVQGALSEIPESLVAALAEDGVLVAARPDPGAPMRQHVVRIVRDEEGGLAETPICPCRLQAILSGEARAL
jgi:protein-L-isoaspartate(D-aspartate) O-methyltransferase